MSTPPTVVARRASRESAFVGLSDAQRLLDEVGDELRVLAELVLELDGLGEVLQPDREQPGGGLLAGPEQERRRPDHRRDGWCRTVGVLRERQIRQHVVTRFAPACLEVLGEPVVEPLAALELVVASASAERDRGGTVAAQSEAHAERLVVVLGHPEDIGDREHRERLGIGRDELTAPGTDDAVQLVVGEAPHELLVLLQPSRRDDPHQQRPFPGVIGRVHRDHVLVAGEEVTALGDGVADVVAGERAGDREERPRGRVARREDVVVTEDLVGFVVPGHGHDPAVLVDVLHGALRAQVLVVRIRIVHQLAIREEVDRIEVLHWRTPSSATPIPVRDRPLLGRRLAADADGPQGGGGRRRSRRPPRVVR